MRIVRWDQLAEGVPEWARGGLRNVYIQGSSWEEAQSHKAASALFKFFQHAPNLRLLRLDYLPFHWFDTADSVVMRTTHLLPRLRDLTVFGDSQFPHSVISDILATSNRQVSHLYLYKARRAISPIPSEQLDFGGNLRYLHVGGPRSITDFQLLARSLVGLREVRLAEMDGESGVRARELLAEVAPSLEKLTISDGDITGLVDSFPFLARLTRLSLYSVLGSLDSLLLPPSLVFLHFWNDDNLLPLLDRWKAEPSLLPATLQHVNICFVKDHRTLERLPSLAKLGTKYDWGLELLLRGLSPRSLRFTTLEVHFHEPYLDKVAAVQTECARLGVQFFPRRLEKWEF